MQHNIYRGIRFRGSANVTKNGVPLPLLRSLKLRNHSPTGFGWGGMDHLSAQLALALLLEETDQDTALLLYQDYKFEIVSRFEAKHWTTTSLEIAAWLQSCVYALANGADAPTVVMDRS